MLLVLFLRVEVYENVVQISDNEYVEILSQYLVYYLLKCCRDISQLKRHHLIFKQFVSCLECCFSLVFFSYANEVKRISQIQLRVSSRA